MFPIRSAVSVAARAYPLKSGYTRIARLRPLQAMTAEHELGYARLRNGDKLFVDLGDQVGRAIYYLGDYDPKITWLCRRILRRGDTMLDVGANMGVVTMYSSDFV